MKIPTISHRVLPLAFRTNPHFRSSAFPPGKSDIFSLNSTDKRYILHALTHPSEPSSIYLAKNGEACGLNVLNDCLKHEIIHPMMTLGELLKNNFDSEYDSRTAYDRSLLCETARVGSVKAFIELWGECIGHDLDAMAPGKDGLNPFQTIILGLISQKVKRNFFRDSNPGQHINIEGCYQILNMLLDYYGSTIQKQPLGSLKIPGWEKYSHQPISQVIRDFNFILPPSGDTSSPTSYKNGLKLVK